MEGIPAKKNVIILIIVVSISLPAHSVYSHLSLHCLLVLPGTLSARLPQFL